MKKSCDLKDRMWNLKARFLQVRFSLGRVISEQRKVTRLTTLRIFWGAFLPSTSFSISEVIFKDHPKTPFKTCASFLLERGRGLTERGGNTILVSRCLFCGIEVAQVSSLVSRSCFGHRDCALCCSALRSSSSWDQPVRVFWASTSCTLEGKKISAPKKKIEESRFLILTKRVAPLKRVHKWPREVFFDNVVQKTSQKFWVMEFGISVKHVVDFLVATIVLSNLSRRKRLNICHHNFATFFTLNLTISKEMCQMCHLVLTLVAISSDFRGCCVSPHEVVSKNGLNRCLGHNDSLSLSGLKNTNAKRCLFLNAKDLNASPGPEGSL